MKSIVVASASIAAAAISTTAVLGSVGLIPGFPVFSPLYEAAVNARTVNRLPTQTPTPLPTQTPAPTAIPTRTPPRPTATPQPAVPTVSAVNAVPTLKPATAAAPTPPPPPATAPVAAPTQKPAAPAPTLKPATAQQAPPTTAKPTPASPAGAAARPAQATLSAMLVQLGDLAPGFSQTRAEPVEFDAATFSDAFGVSYARGGMDAFFGTALVDNQAFRARSMDQAKQAFADFPPPVEGAQPTSSPTVGDESKAWTIKSSDKGAMGFVILFRKGSLISTVATGGLGAAGFDDILRYARVVAGRLT